MWQGKVFAYILTYQKLTNSKLKFKSLYLNFCTCILVFVPLSTKYLYEVPQYSVPLSSTFQKSLKVLNMWTYVENNQTNKRTKINTPARYYYKVYFVNLWLLTSILLQNWSTIGQDIKLIISSFFIIRWTQLRVDNCFSDLS